MNKLFSLIFAVMYVLLVSLVIMPSQEVQADTDSACEQEADNQNVLIGESESLPSLNNGDSSDVSSPSTDYGGKETPGDVQSSSEGDLDKGLDFNEDSYADIDEGAQKSLSVENKSNNSEVNGFTGQEHDNVPINNDSNYDEEFMEGLDCDKPGVDSRTSTKANANDLNQQSSCEEDSEMLTSSDDYSNSNHEDLDNNTGCPGTVISVSQSEANLKTADSYTVIETQDDFDLIRDNLNGYFKLISDINLTGTWNPIGQEENNTPFSGTFDGQGFTISNLLVNSNTLSEEDYAGFFGYTSDATIKNVNLVDVEVSGTENVGALVGKSYNTMVESCVVSGEVRGSGNNVGGLVGWAANTSINRSSVTGIVAGDADRVGGFVGQMTGSSFLENAKITYSSSDTKVSGLRGVGGLVGLTLAQCLISDSYATGTVEGGCCVGGLAGDASRDTTIINCYAASQIISGSLPALSTGGLVGRAHSQTTGLNSYWDLCSSGQTESALGIGLTEEQMLLVSSFEEWDFEQTWHIGEGINNPILQWQLEQENGNDTEQPEQENGEEDHRAPEKLFSSGFIMFAMDYSPFVPLNGEAIVDLIVSKLNEAGLLLEIIRAEEIADTEELYYVMELLQEVQYLLNRHYEQFDEADYEQLLDRVIIMIIVVTGLMETN